MGRQIKYTSTIERQNAIIESKKKYQDKIKPIRIVDRQKKRYDDKLEKYRGIYEYLELFLDYKSLIFDYNYGI
jgi:hypothetical protein